MTNLQLGVSTYLEHRIGAIAGFAVGSLFLAFFTENQPILNQAIGRAYFFWAWGLIMATIPSIIVLSWRDSLKCLLFILSVMGICGALAFVLPFGALTNVLSIFMISFIAVMVWLRKNRPKSFILDLKPRLTPYMFAESLVIFAISWVCASVLQVLGATSGLITSSPIVTYLVLWALLFAIISTIIAAARIATHSSISRIQIETSR